MWAGSVMGAGVIAFSKRIPSRAKASMPGVAPALEPYAPTWSARRVSMVTMRMLSAGFGRRTRWHAAAAARLAARKNALFTRRRYTLAIELLSEAVARDPDNGSGRGHQEQRASEIALVVLHVP